MPERERGGAAGCDGFDVKFRMSVLRGGSAKKWIGVKVGFQSISIVVGGEMIDKGDLGLIDVSHFRGNFEGESTPIEGEDAAVAGSNVTIHCGAEAILTDIPARSA